MPTLPYAQFSPIPLKAIRPQGWIAEFLHRQSSGLTGHVEVSGYPYGLKFWGSADDDTRGSYAAWWPYEQTAYWLDGALKCGFLIGDNALYQRALEEIDFAVDHPAPDGFIGPDSMRDKDRWPYAVFFRAVLAQYEITGDQRYLQALLRHYDSTAHPMLDERDVSGVEILVNLYGETCEPSLLAQAEDLYARYNARYPESDCSLQTLASDKVSTTHGVTFNELGKLGALLYAANGQSEALNATLNGYAKLERDQLLASGLHSCSEHLRGRDPLDSHETCDVTDHTWSLSWLLQITGDPRYADSIEQILFNAAPGGVTKDFRALQYFSCPNQLVSDGTSNHNYFMRGYNWMQYRPDHEVQCCPGNVHRAMPNYVARSWLRGRQNEIVAALFGPGQIQTTAGEANVPVTITSTTNYPFEEAVEFNFQMEQAVEFTFVVRIPAWCQDAALTINGKPLNLPLQAGSFQPIRRTWLPGDRLRLALPFSLRLAHWPSGGVSLHYGPLTLSLAVDAQVDMDSVDSTEMQRRYANSLGYVERPKAILPDFPAYRMTPTATWNYALCLDEAHLAEQVQVTWNSGSGYPLDQPPLTVRVPARRVRGWRLSRRKHVVQFVHRVTEKGWWAGSRKLTGTFTLTPPLPDPNDLQARLGKQEWIELVPYGCTLLRLTVFPQGC